MKLKYEAQINKYNFDFKEFIEQERDAFRWVFSDINDSRNFKPVYILNSQLESIEEAKGINDCTGYSLSFFNTVENAKKRFETITKDKPLLYKKLGTHVAQGSIVKQDGISNRINRFGHFEHFEYENVVFDNKFEIIDNLV